MATGNIKGITIEIDGNTTGLEKSLKSVNTESEKIQSELKEVEKALKLDPSNVDLVNQKMDLLADAVNASTTKLDALRAAQSQVEAQFRNGDIGEEQYRAFNRELSNTEATLRSYQTRMQSLNSDQDRLAQTTRQLGTFFDATNTDVEQFAGTLGTRLTQAIREGTATADQMERALRLMGKQALGASTDIDQMRVALQSADNGANLDTIRQDLARIGEEANQAGDEVNGFGDDLKNVVAGLVAGGGIAGVVSQALDVSTLNTKIDITFDVPEESKAAVRDAIKTVEAYGVDGEEALEAVRRQWALNADATDESNAKIIQGAGAIAKAYQGIDMIELVQEVNEIGAAMKISNEDAIALTNSLLKAGFPPEQLDTISEYTTQMEAAGFSTAEIQSIFEQGIDTKSWNIDNLNDGVKEARLQMATFGSEIPKALKPVLENAGLSEKQFLAWGQAVAKGGAEGSQAMAKVVTYLDKMEEGTAKNDLATAVFATKWEDQGQNMISVFQGLATAQDQTASNQAELNNLVEGINSDPAVRMKDALNNMMTALTPLLTKMAEVVGKIADWVSENPAFAASIAAIGTVVGILTGAFALLMPAVGAIISAWPVLSAGIAAVAVPITIAIASITALSAIGVALYKNWDEISAGLKKTWETIKSNASSAFKQMGDSINKAWESVKSATTNVWSAIKSALETAWNAIKNAATNTFNSIKTSITDVFNAVKTSITNVWNAIKSTLTSLWNGLKSTASSTFNGIKSAIETVWNAVKSATTNTWNTMKSSIQNAINTIKGVISAGMQLIKGDWQGAWNTLKSTLSNMLDNMKSILRGTNLFSIGQDIISGLVKGIKNMTGKAIEAVTGVVDGVVNKAKNLLGIKSPSRVFMDIGHDTNAGFIEGIKENNNKLQKTVGSVYGSLASSAEKSADISNRYNTNNTSTTVNNSMPVNVTLNYSGNAPMADVRDMVDIIDKELANRLKIKARMVGVKLR